MEYLRTNSYVDLLLICPPKLNVGFSCNSLVRCPFHRRSEDTAAAIKATEAKKQAKVHLALSSAVIKNDLAEVEKLLAAKANVNEKDQKGSTPLIHAVWPENVEVVEMLLDNDADPNIQNLRLNTALHFAYEKDNEHIINLLLAYGGTMSLHVKNSQGKTPVMLTNSE